MCLLAGDIFRYSVYSIHDMTRRCPDGFSSGGLKTGKFVKFIMDNGWRLAIQYEIIVY